MSGRRFTDAAALLHNLLDRQEARPDSQRLLGRVDEAAFTSVRDEAECVARLEAAERAGGVRIVRRRTDGVDRIQHVALTNPASLYGHLGRTPARQQADDALATLRCGAAPEIQPILEEIAAAWRRKVSRFRLRPGATPSLEKALKLVEALQTRAGNAGAAEVDYRTFSHAVAGDSKALERLRGPTLGLLRRLLPEQQTAELEDVELLGSLGVVRLPQPFLASGPLGLGGVATPPMTYVGVPPEAAEALTLTRPVDYLLIIENFTSFIRHIREVNTRADGLIVFSGGFPSRAAKEAIVKLAGRIGAPAFHWGDLDPGGVRIFVHLEDALAAKGVRLQPHLMSTELLERRGTRRRTSTRPLGPPPAGTAIAELWRMFAAPDSLELEQEAVDPTSPNAEE